MKNIQRLFNICFIVVRYTSCNNKINTIELYEKNGIISINDLSSITMQQDNNKKIFFYNMGLTLNKKKKERERKYLTSALIYATIYNCISIVRCCFARFALCHFTHLVRKLQEAKLRRIFSWSDRIRGDFIHGSRGPNGEAPEKNELLAH